MSCIFCYSFYHISQNCDIHISDGDREKVAEARNLCVECLSKKCVSKPSNRFFHRCQSLNHCNICFSEKHNTFFCPDRFKAPNFFIPNIDQNLLLRFLAMLDAHDRQLLAFHSPKIFNLCKFLPFTMVNNLYISSVDEFLGHHVISCKHLEICTYEPSKIFKNMVLKKLEFYAENIKISRLSLITCNFYTLLSARTKRLMLKAVNFSNKITLDEIFEKAPNLEEFDYEFGYESENSANLMLDENFFKYKYGRRFRKLNITVYNDTDVKKLIPFLEKSTSNIQIDVYVNFSCPLKSYREIFMSKMSEFFVPSLNSSSPSVSVYIEKWDNWENKYDFFGSFVVKKIQIDNLL